MIQFVFEVSVRAGREGGREGERERGGCVLRSDRTTEGRNDGSGGGGGMARHRGIGSRSPSQTIDSRRQRRGLSVVGSFVSQRRFPLATSRARFIPSRDRSLILKSYLSIKRPVSRQTK